MCKDRKVDAVSDRVIVFCLDDRSYGLVLSSVDRVIRAVEITPLPGAPEVILGIIDVQGRVIPVADMRHRFQLPARSLSVHDQMVIARSRTRALALVVESVSGVREWRKEEIISADVPEMPYVRGVMKDEHGLILIHDLDAFLALDEAADLERALEGR